MFSRSVHGAARYALFPEECETHLLAESRCSTEERDPKLQSHCADIGDVEVVCDMLFLAWKKKNWPEGWKQLHVGVLMVFVVIFK